MSFWIYAAIQIGTMILAQVLKPHIKRPRSADLEGWFAEDGRPIPLVYGTQALSPNIVWWGDAFAHDFQVPVFGTAYYANMIATLCLGPVAEWLDLQIGGKSLALEPITSAQSSSHAATSVVFPAFPLRLDASSSPVNVQVSGRQLFGGRTQEGGLEGQISIYPGTPNQSVDAMSTHSTAAEPIPDGTARPGTCYVVIGTVSDTYSDRFYFGVTPNPKEMVFLIRTEYTALLEQGLNAGYTTAQLGSGMNPAEIIYDLACHVVRGAGADPALINAQSLADMAAVLEDERFNLSITIASQDQALDAIDEILRHIDGVRTEDPETGLMSFYLIRPGATSVLTITDSNTDELEVEEPNYRDLINDVQVTYRRWSGGVFGAVSSETLTNNLQFLGLKFRLYPSRGRNIANVHAYANGVELTVLVDYTFNAITGDFYLFDTAATNPGDTITVSYSSLPTAMTLVEGTAKEYDLADQQITEEVRSLTVDFPYITQELLAQTLAKRTLRTLGLPLKRLTWLMSRAGHAIRPGHVLTVTSTKWGLSGFRVRVLPPVDYGVLDNGRIKITAVEDVWGEYFLPTPPSGGPDVNPGTPIAPPIVIACGMGGTQVRINLFATDTSFDIELWEANDELGTGATLLTTLPGSTTFYDVGTDITKAHRARLIRSGFTAGEYSPWITCGLAGPPSTPTPVMPTVAEIPSQTDTVGTLELLITDPEHRVTLVEFKHQAGVTPETVFATDAAEPWTDDVDLLFPATSTISYRVSYIDATSQTAVIENTVAFSPPPAPPETVSDAASQPICLPFHTTLTQGADERYPGAAGLGLESGFSLLLENGSRLILESGMVEEFGIFDRRRINLTSCAKVQGQAHVSRPLPAGAKCGWQYVLATNTAPVESDWQELAFESSVLVDADVATEIPMVSPVLFLPLEARDDVVIRFYTTGGDGATQFTVKSVLLFFTGDTKDTGGQGGPDPCDDHTIGFGGYENDTALNDDWTFIQADMPTGSMTLDGNEGEEGGRALLFTVKHCDGCVGGGQVGSYGYKDITGLTPGVLYTVTARIKIGDGFGMGERFGAMVAQKDGLQAFADITLENQWQSITFTDVPRFDSGTTLRLVLGFGAIAYFSILHDEQYKVDHVDIRTPDGGLVNPCSGGPTVPGEPGGGGGGPDPCPDCPPPVTPPSGPQKLYLNSYEESLWGTFPPFTGSAISVPANHLMAFLDRAQAAGISLILTTVSRAQGTVNGVFSQSAYMNTLETYASVGSAAAAHPALIGIRIMDEPNSAFHWGTVVPMAIVDGVLAKRTSEIFPGVPLHLRESATNIEQTGVKLHYVQIAVCHYVKRLGSVAAFMVAQRASAERQSISIGWGMNPTPTGTPWMSASEVRAAGLTMVRDPKPWFHFSVWAGVPTPETVLRNSDYVSAFTDVLTEMN